MTFLREAVQKQKEYLINELVNEGIVLANEHELHDKTISEIINNYGDIFYITTEKTPTNSLQFNRVIRLRSKRKHLL